MNCAEFRRQFHRMLDANQPRRFAGALSEHLQSCHACVTHVDAMEKIDRFLREAPDVVVPPGLEEKLRAIPQLCTAQHKARRRVDIRRAIAGLASIALVAILTLEFAPDFRNPIWTTLTTLTLVIIGYERRHVTSGKF